MKWIMLNLISTLYFIICLCYWLMNSEIFSRYQIVKLLKLQVPLALLYIIEVEAKCAQHAHTSMHPYVPFDDCEYSLLHFSKLPTYFHNLHMSICDIFFLCAATIWKVAFWRRNRWISMCIPSPHCLIEGQVYKVCTVDVHEQQKLSA